MPTFVGFGHRLHYRESGSGPLLLILPGNTASSACHEGELDHFGRRYHAVALDFLGTGGSDRLAGWPDDWWEVAARDAAALVEHLGQERALVVGTSGGAMIALLMAALYPERVRAVVADSCAERLDPEGLRAEMARRRKREPAAVAFWRQAQGEDWESVIEADSDLLLRLADRGGDWLQGRLSRVRCPVLFTASLRDPLVPGAAADCPRMARQLPDAEVFLVNDGWHPLMWSKPDAFRRAADGFLSAHDR